ncbi:MAG: nucleotidyltransferase family protein [Clostridia bacterium]|nr:nucleotidyltransferase family protein [Clostridia bacterium]
MKFCAVICEYNPFHNGHKYQLDRIRELSGCDGILCIMSGNFTQRGEPALLDKHTRARHAVLSGADVVIELPTAFATSTAEVFARGAINVLSSLKNVTTLAFGCECGTAEEFLVAAKAGLREDKRFRSELKRNLKDGASYAKARTQTILALNGDVNEAILSFPNNILGVEYCRALLRAHSDIKPLPIPRVGAGYIDETLYTNFSSATALRNSLSDDTHKSHKLIQQNVPDYVYRDLFSHRPTCYGQAAMCTLAQTDAQTLAQTLDCTEGLENRFKSLSKSNPNYDALLAKMTTKRYTLSRLKRILCANFLGVRKKHLRAFCAAKLYCNVLAVRKDKAERILSSLKESSVHVLVRKTDYARLKKEAAECFAFDVRATDLYNVLSGRETNPYQTVFI